MSSYQSPGAGDGDASVVAQAQEKVQETASQVSSTTAQYVREQTESRGRQAATELQTIADALRRSSHALHAEGNTTAANRSGRTQRMALSFLSGEGSIAQAQAGANPPAFPF